MKNNNREIRYPKHLIEEGCWVLTTKNGIVEIGWLEYILGELCHDGLIYRYNFTNGSYLEHSHSHTFSGVLERLVKDPVGFSITGFEGDYSSQEEAFIKNARNALLNRLNTTSKK